MTPECHSTRRVKGGANKSSMDRKIQKIQHIFETNPEDWSSGLNKIVQKNNFTTHLIDLYLNFGEMWSGNKEGIIRD